MSAAVLVTVSGPDQPGITAHLTRILARGRAKILDIGQAVIYGQLSLTILFELEPIDSQEKTTVKDLLFAATELGLRLDFKALHREDPTFPGVSPDPEHRYAITLISDPITAHALHEVSSILVTHRCNIDRIHRLSHLEFGCVEIQISSHEKINPHNLKKDLLQIAMREQVDIALQSEGLFRRAKRLIVMDMDSTLIQNEVIDEFARERGVYDEVAAITEAAMKGEMNYTESLRRRCEKLKGLTETDINAVEARLQFTPGAEDLIRILKAMGFKLALISGGFEVIANRFKNRLGIDYAFANQMEMKDGVFTGVVPAPIVDAQRKAELLVQIALKEGISLEQVIAIGDGANDVLMLEKAGLGIAFNAKPIVSAKADMALNQRNLRSILYLLGINALDTAHAFKAL